MTGSASLAIRVENLTVREGGAVVLKDVGFSVSPGSIYALLGHDPSSAALMRCMAGRRRADAGRVTILGLDARSRWRLRSRRVFVPSGSDPFSRITHTPPPEVLLLENPERADAGGRGIESPLRSVASAGSAVFLSTREAALAEAVADRIGILSRSRLVADAPPAALRAGFRRIRYSNDQTESRTAFGTELDEFDAVRVHVRGWGIEAVVSNFQPEAFDRFSAIDGVSDATAEPMTLSEIFEAFGGA